MKHALKIAICEDQERDAAQLVSFIRESGLSVEILLFESGGAFLASRPAGRFDLVFFDIYMSGISGMETAKILRESDEVCGIVFTTTSDAHMPEAFDVGAAQYLLKPVQKDKLEQVLQKHIKIIDRSRKTCLVNVRGRQTEVPFDSIYYIEVYNHNCLVHTKNGVIETGTSMIIDDFTALLPAPQFLRCHKSYIVNMSYVESMDQDFLMKNGDVVYVRRRDARKYARELDQWRLFEAGRDT